MRPKSVGLAALFAVLGLVSVRGADQPALLEASKTACLTPKHDEAAIAAAAAAVGAVGEPNPDTVGQVAPVIETAEVRRWMSGDPATKSQTDLLFAANSGTTLGALSDADTVDKTVVSISAENCTGISIEAK